MNIWHQKILLFISSLLLLLSLFLLSVKMKTKSLVFTKNSPETVRNLCHWITTASVKSLLGLKTDLEFRGNSTSLKKFPAKEKLEIVLSAPVPAFTHEFRSGRQGEAGGRGGWGEFRLPTCPPKFQHRRGPAR